MKILYIHQYFLTPSEGGAIRSYYLAKSLVDNGHEVEMITSHNAQEYKVENVEGIKVHYLPVAYDNRFGFFRRIFSFLLFLLKAYNTAKKIEDVELCYATSTPLTIGLIALRLKRKHNIPYYFEVRDLWPEAPIQMGFIKNYFLKKFLYKMEETIYKNATLLVALSPGIRDGIERVVPDKLVYLIPNLSDCTFFKMEAKDKALEEKFKVKDKFVISYFGAIGKVNNLESIIPVMIACQQKNLPVEFLIAGKGAEADKIKALCEKAGLNNTQFLGFLNKEGVSEVMNVTDAAYISFANKPILETNSPNKFFDALAAAKLCITNTKGWIKELVEQKECGFYYDNSSPQVFLDKLTPFLEDKNKLFEFQKNARILAEQHFSREIQTQRFVKLFNKEERLAPFISSVYTLTA
ncbi:MAG TPA: glycosyltransferase family 4 protein [Cytophagaceae bacterium]